MIPKRASSSRRAGWPGLALLAALVACSAAPTPYQPALERYGYSEQQLESERWRVSFAGNSATPRRQVDNYLLYRAAELTVATGHDWFEVADQNVEIDDTGVTAAPRVGVGTGSDGFGIGFSTFLGGTGGGSRYTAYADVLMRDGEKPSNELRAYDAHELLRSLEPEIQRPGA